MTINHWRLWLGIGVSLAFLGFLVLSLDTEKLLDALREANYLFTIPAAALYFVEVYFRAARWGYVLSPMQRFSAWRLYPVVVIGHAANNVLPAHIGELVRAYYLVHRERFSGTAALATIGVERIYDGLVLVCLGALAIPLLILLGETGPLGETEWANDPVRTAILIPSALIEWANDDPLRASILTASALAGVGFFAGLVVITLLAVNPRAAQLVKRILDLLPARIRPQGQRLAASFIEGLSILSSPRQHLTLALRTLPVWLGETVVYLTVAYSFGIQDYFGSFGALFLAILLVTAASNLASVFPFAIGAIGPFEFITVLALAALGVDEEVALSYALVTHLVALWLPVNLAGLALMWKENLSLKQLTSQENAESHQADGAGLVQEKRP